MSRHNTIKIAPSILAADFARLGDDVAAAVQGGADYIHVDVMDGHFVPPITFGAQMIGAIKPYAGVVPLVVHMMVEEPARHIEHIARAGADVIVVHAEACADLAGTVAAVRETGAQAGVAVRPETPIGPILPFLDEIAIALLMTVNPGYGGQPYIPEVETKIAAMRGIIDSRGLDVELEVDGGINENTIEQAVRAGARLFVAGTAVYGRPEPVPERIKILRELAENALA